MSLKTMNTRCCLPECLLELLVDTHHSIWQGSIPDNPLSRQDGMSTSCSRSSPKGGLLTASRLEAFRYCHTPLRLCHRDRCSCGRGYSGHGFVPTLSVHGVVNGGVFGEYPDARTCFAESCLPLPPGWARLAPASSESTVLRNRCIVQVYRNAPGLVGKWSSTRRDRPGPDHIGGSTPYVPYIVYETWDIGPRPRAEPSDHS